MRIGIDIDDTICDTWEFLIPYLSKHFNVDILELKNSNKIYYEACNCTFLEYCNFIKQHSKIWALQYQLKPNVKEVIEKLKQEGHTIIFITARSINGYDDPYQTSLEYLNKNSISFDKLIVNKSDKASVCLEEKIDLFIDDSVSNCKSVSALNIDVLLFATNHNKNFSKFKKVYNWLEIYNEIEKVNNNGRKIN